MPTSRTTFTVSSGGSDRVVVYPGSSRNSSGGSGSVHSPASSGGSRSYSGSAGSDNSWSEVEPPEEFEDDGIEPSDSASRSRQPSTRRHTTTDARPTPVRRHSSHRLREPEEPPQRRHSSRRHHSSRSRRRRAESQRLPSDESSSTVASHDDYPYSHHGAPQPPPPRGYPPQSGYRHMPAPGHGGYPPSIMTSAPGFADPYAAQALVHMPQQDAFGYPSAPPNNPFSPGGPQQNPFSPMSTASGASYFQIDPHAPQMPHHARPPAPQRPQSYMAPSSVYGSEVISPYGHPGMPAYPGYMMPGMPGYPPIPGWYPPPSNHSSPAPPPVKEDKSEENEGIKRLEAIIQKQEEARIAREKEMIAKAEADAAAIAAKEAKEQEEKKKKEEIAAASKKAKEDAEKKAEDAAKKAKEEHEKALKEVENAKEEAEKKQKELEEEKAKLLPAPDTTKAPIRFKDAVGRKFSFPFHLCKTWKGMEGLIRQAFLHVDVIGEHVHQGHYDLLGPDGEIILPQVWETMIQPDWDISMHMWPMPDPEDKKDKAAADALADPFASLGFGDLGIVDPGKKKKKDGSKKKRKDGVSPDIINVGPPNIPPPPGFPPGLLPDPLAGIFPPGISPVEEKKDKSKQKSSSSKSSKNGKGDLPPLASWFAGGSSSRSSKKDDEKLDLVKRKTGSSTHSSSGEQTGCILM